MAGHQSEQGQRRRVHIFITWMSKRMQVTLRLNQHCQSLTKLSVLDTVQRRSWRRVTLKDSRWQAQQYIALFIKFYIISVFCYRLLIKSDWQLFKKHYPSGILKTGIRGIGGILYEDFPIVSINGKPPYQTAPFPKRNLALRRIYAIQNITRSKSLHVIC